jgi:hypothetical protein
MEDKTIQRIARRVSGGYPPCFFLPRQEPQLWEFSSKVHGAVYMKCNHNVPLTRFWEGVA